MSDQEHQFSCYEKVVFESEDAAVAAAMAADWQHGSSLQPYECVECGLWHLSTKY